MTEDDRMCGDAVKKDMEDHGLGVENWRDRYEMEAIILTGHSYIALIT